MEIILLERIERLGQMGDIVTVKAGYARNYLLPQNKALRATKANLAEFETQRGQLETVNLQRRQEAESVSTKMDGVMVMLIRQAGESGQLYGSVSARDLAEALTEAGYTVEKRQVQIERPIKNLGIHEIRLVLHPEVTVTVKANIAQSDEEAERQVEDAEKATAVPVEAAEPTPEAEPEAEQPAEDEGDSADTAESEEEAPAG